MISRCHVFEEELRRSSADVPSPLSDAFAEHLDECASCRASYDRGAVPLDIASLESLDPAARARLIGNLVTRHRWQWRWVAVAAAIVAIAGLATLRSSRSGATNLEVALVEDHIRYLDLAQRHTPGERSALLRDLDGYVDFPFQLPEVDAATLTGTRRCYLLGRRVVLAFYESRGTPVSYFVLPSDGLRVSGESCGDGALRCAATHGFSVVTWQRAGLLHGIVAGDAGTAAQFAAQSLAIEQRSPDFRTND